MRIGYYSPTSQLLTAQASAIQYATYECHFHVRFDGGIGSKSALDAAVVLAKLEGSGKVISPLLKQLANVARSALTLPHGQAEMESALESAHFACLDIARCRRHICCTLCIIVDVFRVGGHLLRNGWYQWLTSKPAILSTPGSIAKWA